MLVKGSSGVDVKNLQLLLTAISFALVADGIFGAKTEAAVKAFQKKYELPVHGRADDPTMKALRMLHIHKTGTVQLSAHFNENEFACKGDGLVKVDPRLVNKLEMLRRALGAPITITRNGGYRSPEHNKKVGGAAESQHMLGTAADIKARGKTPAFVANIAERIGFGGIGIYRTWVHVDVREGKARWRG